MKNTTFLALLRLFFALESTKSDLKHLLKHIFRGEGGGSEFVKSQSHKLMKTLKMPKNKQSNLIASVKRPNIGFINKYIKNSGIGGGGGVSSVS